MRAVGLSTARDIQRKASAGQSGRGIAARSVGFLTDGEMMELLKAHHPHGKRFYINRANHVIDHYRVFVKWAAANHITGGSTSRLQIAQQMWPSLETYEDAQGFAVSQRRWERTLKDIGVLEVRERFNERGQSVGVSWQLLNPAPSKIGDILAGVAQSVGSPASCDVRRRRESAREREERRIAPWRRRSGQKGVGRLVRATSFDGRRGVPPQDGPLFSGLRFDRPVAPGEAPKGAPPGAFSTSGDIDLSRSPAAAAGCAREIEIDAIERQRARAALLALAARREPQAAPEADNGISDPVGVPAWLVDRVAHWLAGEPARRAELEQLAGHPSPGYEQLFRAFQLTYGACDWHRHATQKRRDQVKRAIARYDREAPRLAELGHPPAEATAMAWLIAAMAASNSTPGSPGYWATPLDRESKEMRRRRRELDPAEPGRRDRRRERRVQRMAAAMHCGIRFRRSTLPPAAVRRWLADGMMAGTWAAVVQTWEEALDAAGEAP